MTILLLGTYSAILTRRTVTKVNLCFAVSTHITWFTVAMVIIHKLHTILCPLIKAWIGKAFIDITLTTWSNKSWRTLTLETSHFIDTSSIIMAGPRFTVINIDFAYYSQSSRWTRTTETIYKIVACTAILTWIWITIIDVKLAVLTLEARGTFTRI